MALSTCAAEYVAFSDDSQHLAHINNLLIDINHTLPMKIYCDDEAAILIVRDNTSKKKTKYLCWAFYFINDSLQQYQIRIRWKKTQDQVADILTKRLGPNLVKKVLPKLRLKWFWSQPRVGVLEAVDGLGCDTRRKSRWLGFCGFLVLLDLVCSCAAA